MPRVSNSYNLQLINIRLASEWHPTKNGELTPRDVTPNSGRKVWWLCSSGHEWSAIINSRSRSSEAKCPYCIGKRVCDDNCLATINPKLAKEWHPTKNAKLTPRDVTTGSGKKVWWLCKRNHEWSAVVGSRNDGRGCPYCARQRN